MERPPPDPMGAAAGRAALDPIRAELQFLQDTVCEVCGNIGYKHLLARCRDCKCSAVHLYCLDKVIFDASLAEWWCDECLQRRGEVTCSRSLEKVSTQRSPNHDHSGSTIHPQVTKRVKSARNAGPRRKSKEDIPSAKYSLDSDDLQASSNADYVLSYKSYISEAQKQKVIAFIKEIQPKITVFVAVMQKRNVQPLSPFLKKHHVPPVIRVFPRNMHFHIFHIKAQNVTLDAWREQQVAY